MYYVPTDDKINNNSSMNAIILPIILPPLKRLIEKNYRHQAVCCLILLGLVLARFQNDSCNSIDLNFFNLSIKKLLNYFIQIHAQ